MLCYSIIKQFTILLRLYVQRKSDIRLYIGHIHDFYVDTNIYSWSSNQFD